MFDGDFFENVALTFRVALCLYYSLLKEPLKSPKPQ
jgi:hypothetical protein